MCFTLFFYCCIFALFFCKKSFSAGDPDPISIQGAMFDETSQSSSSNQPSQQPPRWISTGRLKPMSGSGSPRMSDAQLELDRKGHKFIKGVSHTPVMGNPVSPHQYPKVTIRPGRKSASVISMFHHPARPTPDAKPLQYMLDQKADTHSDITQPASTYKIGLRSIHGKSEELKQFKTNAIDLSRNHYHPKAVLIQILPGDSRAERKRPTIDVDQGKLHGNLMIASYGPESPPKQGSPRHQH